MKSVDRNIEKLINVDQIGGRKITKIILKLFYSCKSDCELQFRCRKFAIKKIKNVILQNEGEVPLYFRFDENNETKTLRAGDSFKITASKYFFRTLQNLFNEGICEIFYEYEK